MVAVALAIAPPAGACCRGVHLHPPGHERGERPLPTLAIGDSVMLGAARRLRRAGFEVDAREGRFMRHALAILRRRRAKRTLPRVVVIAIGTNYPARYREILRAVRRLGPGRTLALVTPKRSYRAIGLVPIRRAARRFPRRVRVVNWVAYSARHPEWFYGDGTHLRPSGVRAYTRLLGRLVSRRQPRALASAAVRLGTASLE